MAQKKKRKPTKAPEAEAPEPPPTHTELLWIAGAFLILGLILTFAQAGQPVPVPPGTPGAQRAAILVSAPDMRLYGWVNLVLGIATLGIYYRIRTGQRHDLSVDSARPNQ
jgi:hypothetical protein